MEEPLTALALVLAVAAGGLAQGATGIGFGLVAAPASALALDSSLVVGTVVRLALLVDVALAVQGRAAVDLRTVRNYLASALLALPFGLVALAVLTDRVLVLGASLLTVVGAAVLLRARDAADAAVAPPARGPQLLAGFAGGFMGVTTGMSGPPVAVEAARRHASPAETRSSLALFFAPVDLAAAAANPDAVSISQLALLAVAALVGLAVAHRVAHRVRGARARRVLAAMITAGALAAAIRQFT